MIVLLAFSTCAELPVDEGGRGACPASTGIRGVGTTWVWVGSDEATGFFESSVRSCVVTAIDGDEVTSECDIEATMAGTTWRVATTSVGRCLEDRVVETYSYQVNLDTGDWSEIVYESGWWQPYELAVGDSWVAEVLATVTVVIDGTFIVDHAEGPVITETWEVVERENVSVEAGTYDAFKVQGSSIIDGERISPDTLFSWWTPGVGTVLTFAEQLESYQP